MLLNAPRLQAALDERGLDGLIAASPYNVFYLTGIQKTERAYAVITRDAPAEPFLVSHVSTLDMALGVYHTLKGVVGYGVFFREWLGAAELTEEEKLLHKIAVDTAPAKSELEGLVLALERMGLADKAIGIEEEGVLPGFIDTLRERIKGRLVPASDLLRWSRMVKTEEEIQRIRHSARVTERAIVAVQGAVRPGVTEYELAREFDRSVASQGGRPEFTLIRFGRNGISGQVESGDTRLNQGDTVWIDAGCTYQGYWSDLARVLALGEPSQRVKDFYQAMLAGEDAALQRAKAGMTAGELFDLTVQAVRQAGVPHYRRHHVGHGIGVEVYDPPVIVPGGNTPLENGMVITVETPYYEFGFGAVHVEDPFVVRAQGNLLLTELGRGLYIVE